MRIPHHLDIYKTQLQNMYMDDEFRSSTPTILTEIKTEFIPNSTFYCNAFPPLLCLAKNFGHCYDYANSVDHTLEFHANHSLRQEVRHGAYVFMFLH